VQAVLPATVDLTSREPAVAASEAVLQFLSPSYGTRVPGVPRAPGIDEDSFALMMDLVSAALRHSRPVNELTGQSVGGCVSWREFVKLFGDDDMRRNDQVLADMDAIVASGQLGSSSKYACAAARQLQKDVAAAMAAAPQQDDVARTLHEAFVVSWRGVLCCVLCCVVLCCVVLRCVALCCVVLCCVVLCCVVLCCVVRSCVNVLHLSRLSRSYH
jgi:hypothetical protein